MVDLRWLRVTAAVEGASLLLLIINLLTVHLGAVTSLAGPVHGGAWLATMAIAFLTPVPRLSRWMSLLPGVGGLLAVRHAARAPADGHRR
jgi:hypothetical protein